MSLRRIMRRIGFAPDVWRGWPERAYRREGYLQRLEFVQQQLAGCLDAAPPGPLRIISVCAGDGRDVIGTLASHARREDVSALLVELNPESVALGVNHRAKAALEDRVTLLNDDATVFEAYQNFAPADIVLVCGVWGHVPPKERGPLVRGLASLCKPGGVVLWSRGVKRGMQRLLDVEAVFTDPTWSKVCRGFTPDNRWAVVVHRYCGPPVALPPSGRIFRFRRTSGN